MRNISNKVVEKNKTPISFSTNTFRKSAVYEIKMKNLVESPRLQTTIWRMRIECWISKTTQAH